MKSTRKRICMQRRIKTNTIMKIRTSLKCPVTVSWEPTTIEVARRAKIGEMAVLMIQDTPVTEMKQCPIKMRTSREDQGMRI